MVKNLLKELVNKFNIAGRTIVVTGGAGLLGIKHAESIAEFGGNPVLLDINDEIGDSQSQRISKQYDVNCKYYNCDITKESSITNTTSNLIKEFGKIDGLINNAAKNEKMEEGQERPNYSLESLDLNIWKEDFDISVTGAFLCSRVIGPKMVENGGGVILNISSDLGIIAPDQRIYRQPGLSDEEQTVKPVTYSVVKHALIGLTKYLSTYWIGKNMRVNTLCPGGVFSGQPNEIVEKLEYRIPLGRMANIDDYKSAIVFMVSDASEYMNGSTIVMDGGRSVW